MNQKGLTTTANVKRIETPRFVRVAGILGLTTTANVKRIETHLPDDVGTALSLTTAANVKRIETPVERFQFLSQF